MSRARGIRIVSRSKYRAFSCLRANPGEFVFFLHGSQKHLVFTHLELTVNRNLEIPKVAHFSQMDFPSRERYDVRTLMLNGLLHCTTLIQRFSRPAQSNGLLVTRTLHTLVLKDLLHCITLILLKQIFCILCLRNAMDFP